MHSEGQEADEHALLYSRPVKQAEDDKSKKKDAKKAKGKEKPKVRGAK